ncbi:hypothetical protein AB0F18_37180, partial [Streptomyces sp. NPDC029216]
MSQQGAEDWWQKLYEDPDAGSGPDPGDTLDQRFRSASVMVGDQDPPLLPGPRAAHTAPAGPPVAPEAAPADVPPPRLDKPAAPLPPPRRDPRVTGATGY